MARLPPGDRYELRQISFSPEVGAFIDGLKAGQKSATIDEIIKQSKAFKEWKECRCKS